MALHKDKSIWRLREHVLGEMEAFICRSCGLMEWYVKDAAQIPLEETEMQLLDGKQEGEEGPYR